MQEPPVTNYGLFNLDCQLSRRRNDERFDDFPFGCMLVAEPVQNRQHKSGGLARARLAQPMMSLPSIAAGIACD